MLEPEQVNKKANGHIPISLKDFPNSDKSFTDFLNNSIFQKAVEPQLPVVSETKPIPQSNPLAAIMGDRGTDMTIVDEPIEEVDEIYATVEYDYRTNFVLSNHEMTIQKMVKNQFLIERVYIFLEFRVLKRYVMDMSDNPFELYDFHLNGLDYRMRTFGEMKDILKEQSCQGSRSNAITGVLREYVENLPKSHITKSCGFLEEGWRLPGTHVFNTRDEMIKETIEHVREMYEKPPDEARARIFYKQLHSMIHTTYKDIVFAYGLAGPFLHLLKKIYKIMPVLILEGEKAGGKSILVETISKKFYNQVLANRDVFDSVSRFLSALAGSTFPRGFDEVEVSAHEIGPALKNHTTSIVPFQRKNPKQQLLINAELLAPLVLSFNRVPKFLLDRAMRDRILHLKIERTKQDESITEWLEIYNKIEDGVIGRYLIEKTKDWDYDKIMEILGKIEKDEYKDTRSILMDKILRFGAYLSKEFFDVELDLSELHRSIEDSKKKAIEELQSCIEEMLYLGTQRDSYGNFKRVDWVTIETISHHKKGDEWGVVLTSTHKKIICKRMKIKELNFESFCELLRDFYPSARFERLKVKIGGNYRTVRGVFISSMDILGENGDIYDKSVESYAVGLPDGFF